MKVRKRFILGLEELASVFNFDISFDCLAASQEVK